MDQPHPLRAFRDSHDPKMKLRELAGLLGVSRATVSRWETGERFPERELWPRIREVTGLGPEDLSVPHKVPKAQRQPLATSEGAA